MLHSGDDRGRNGSADDRLARMGGGAARMLSDADLLELMRRRRSARVHAAEAVPEDALAAVIEAARWAPSAANRQPWTFVTIADPALKQRLRAAFVDEARGRDPRYRAVTEKQADLLLAPGLILVCGDPRTKERFVNAAAIGDAVQEELFLLSMGAAIQNLLLMAAARGLTGTWLARPARLPAVRDLLDVPAHIRSIAFVALGVAATPPAWDPHMRRPALRHRDRYGSTG